MTIINRRLILANDPRHRLNQVTVMSHRDLLSTDAKIDQIADQPTRHRVGVGPHIDRAAATDANSLDNVVRVEPVVWKSIWIPSESGGFQSPDQCR